MANLPYFTRCGLPGIDLVPYGIHACHFYRSRDQLIAALAPYFEAGLRANERCLWITAPPLPAGEAAEALRDACDGVEEAIERGALRIVDFEDWYPTSARLKRVDVVQLWLEEEARALAEGYIGLRITGNMSFLTPDDWPTFREYEQDVTARFNGRRIVALCSYEIAQGADPPVDEIVRAHNCAFEHRAEDWVVAAS